MQVYSYQPPNRRASLKRNRPLGKLIFGLILVGFGLFLILGRRDSASPEAARNQQSQPTRTHISESEKKPDPLPSVQQIVENFVTGNQGEYSIVVTDIEAGENIGEFKIDKAYFAASLYKMYVAYLGYLDVQNGEYSLDEPFLGNWSRKECLDKMIRESHSPCAEKLWVEQGKARSTDRLKKLGIKNTNMEGLTTTAEDINVMLVRLHNRKDLNDAHTDLFLESLKQNIYRDVLPAALPNLTVMDKVGFRELVEYHDVGIILLPNNKPVAISILTKNAGTKRMVGLTQAVFKPLQEASR
jgi:hypothetical protein